MDPNTKSALNSEVPPKVLWQVFLGIFLFLAPAVLLVVYPEFNEHPFAFGGKSVAAYYLVLVGLYFRVAWKDREKLIEAEQRTDEKMRDRPILGPLWRIGKLLDLVGGIFFLGLLVYLLVALFK